MRQAPTINPDECLIGPKDVALLTGMTVRWVQESFRYEDLGGVAPIKIGRRLRWPLWQVKAWIADREREAKS